MACASCCVGKVFNHFTSSIVNENSYNKKRLCQKGNVKITLDLFFWKTFVFCFYQHIGFFNLFINGLLFFLNVKMENLLVLY